MSSAAGAQPAAVSGWGPSDGLEFVAQIRQWGREFGFNAIGVGGIDLTDAEPGLMAWVEAGFHGDMDYMARHGLKRARAAELVPGTVRVISARMDYWPAAADAGAALADPQRAYVSRYALGRDYHKVLRARLQKLAERIAAAVPHQYRVFTDSAPVLEVEHASRNGLGWRGKHTLLLDRSAGSWFFLGEIFTDLPLPVDERLEPHCGRCTACIDACPTGAIVAPYRVDARRCISYLTIELQGAIPEALRPQLGNRIYGCDDCQLACPWNRFAQLSCEPDFAPRHRLDSATLVELFAWSAADFAERTAGSPIYRIGHERWLRNIAVALGNAPTTAAVLAALQARAQDDSAIVREHVAWALDRHGGAASG
ncbi:MAG TPA: tRNA epoxyqueuosine(34) reductase QueG [Thauera sp.]|nr:tRNA epoxyqueuosine(34) reductase QueG [Thauera sp.]